MTTYRAPNGFGPLVQALFKLLDAEIALTNAAPNVRVMGSYVVREVGVEENSAITRKMRVRTRAERKLNTLLQSELYA